MIAQTELAEAMSEAALRTYDRLGIEGKEWLTAYNPCDICLSNESDGAIPVGQSFSSGHMRPPAHPRCLCSLAPIGTLR